MLILQAERRSSPATNSIFKNMESIEFISVSLIFWNIRNKYIVGCTVKF